VSLVVDMYVTSLSSAAAVGGLLHAITALCRHLLCIVVRTCLNSVENAAHILWLEQIVLILWLIDSNLLLVEFWAFNPSSHSLLMLTPTCGQSSVRTAVQYAVCS